MRHSAEQFLLPLKSGKAKYSYSQLEAAKCGRKHYYSKTNPREKDFSFNLAAGQMLDCAFNGYYADNMHLTETHEQRMEYARASVELLLKEHPEYYTIPWSAKAGDVRSSPENYVSWLFDRGALELVARHDRGPVEVQKKIELELPNFSLVGYVDCLELSTNTVVDIKSVTGYSTITEAAYALRTQVLMYRMILRDGYGLETKGRYELLLCRKSPKLAIVPDLDIEYLQDKLIRDFDEHHRKLTQNIFEKNPDNCFQYNKLCPFFAKCWPEVTAALTPNQTKTDS